MYYQQQEQQGHNVSANFVTTKLAQNELAQNRIKPPEIEVYEHLFYGNIKSYPRFRDKLTSSILDTFFVVAFADFSRDVSFHKRLIYLVVIYVINVT